MRLASQALVYSLRRWIGVSYCPIISRKDHSPLVYDTSSINAARRLKLERVNFFQTDHNNLIKLLERQITTDKSSFYKEKEIVFVGRSNTGKSSLLNKMFETKVARVAKKPGTTKYMHFYGLENNSGVIVDTPGYGFADMNRRRRDMWFGCLYEYFKVSSRACQIVLCVNGEHGLKRNDLEFLRRTHQMNLNIQVVLTKIDKLKEDKLFYRMVEISNVLDVMGFKNISDKIIATSSRTYFGIESLKCFIVEALMKSPQRKIDDNEDLLLQYLKGNRVTPQDITAQSQKQLSKPYLVKKLMYNSKYSRYLV